MIVPIKEIGIAKSRLRPALNDEERRGLVRRMLGHVVATAQSASNVSDVTLLSSAQPDLPIGALINDHGPDLNGALGVAVNSLGSDVTRVVIIAADLPKITRTDVEMLAGAPPRVIAIAPDRAERGTNALSLPLPQARAFRFAFGPDSLARHQAEAARLGVPIDAMRSDTLALDIDEPADLTEVDWLA